MINVFLHRIVVSLFPAFMLILKLPLKKYKLYYNQRFFILNVIGVLSTSIVIIFCAGNISVTFSIPNVITWGIIPLTNWLIMGFCFLYFYTKQFFLLDTLFLTSATLRVMGEIHEIPIALINGYFLNNFMTGLIYISFLILYAKQNKWKRTTFFLPLFAIMLIALLITPHLYFTRSYMTLFSYLSRFISGLVCLEFARGFGE